MPQVVSPSLILRVREYSETSQIVLLFSRADGKLSVIAKGARRPGSRFEGSLDLLCLGEATYYRRRNRSLHTLAAFDRLTGFWHIRRDLERIYAAQSILELVRELTPEEVPHPELFDEAVESLRRLEEGKRTLETVASFHLRALRATGFGPRLDRCVECEAPLTEPVAFSPASGGMVCRAHGDRPDAIPVEAGIQRALDVLASRGPDRIRVAPRQGRAILQLLAAHTTHRTGRPLRMTGYL